ncbi:hypothetical protein GOODEAATRI_027563 [Goodea atripinnis]|uniref:Uncharacterized protein n=1 Tax=Goodea atripinnis TaxID=208336 RepID=A0ABV0P1S8_9TELE
MERNRTVSVFDSPHIELIVLRFGFVLVLRFSYERSDRLVVTFNISRFMRSTSGQGFAAVFHLKLHFNMNPALKFGELELDCQPSRALVERNIYNYSGL